MPAIFPSNFLTRVIPKQRSSMEQQISQVPSAAQAAAAVAPKRRHRKKKSADLYPSLKTKDLRSILASLGSHGLSKLTKPELALQYKRVERNNARKEAKKASKAPADEKKIAN